jgi:GTP pyrophosphokinase
MSKIKNELEELAFRYLEPKPFETLRRKVESRRRATEGLIEELTKTISAKLAEAQVPIIHIDGRIKRLFSIHQKLKRQKIELDQVYDFMALRIVTDSVRDCYAALGIIHQTWSPVPGRIKDFIAMPRPNGYQSLHTSVISERGFPFEVQIRTAEMHRVAEEGIAAHWKYKEGRLGADRDEQYFVWLRQLLEFQQEVRDPQEFLQNLKIELYPEEVYIFTPAGEVKVLPRGATPVDFAYSIHTDVGHQCVGSKVNGKMVPLRTRLRNGDIVQIVTAPGHHPSRDWLNFVVTSRARNKIKHYIHAEEKERSLELGRKLFEKEARRYGLNLKSLTEGAAFATTLTEYGYSKPEELFVAIGYGKLAPRMLLTKLVPQEQLKEAPESGIASVVRRVLGPAEEKIKVRGFDDLMVFRARCCNPIRGEKIVGYVTRGKGVSVHSASCPNVVNLLYDPERRIEVEWDKGTDASPYTVRLSLQVEDRKGILADVTSKIAGINTNIRNVEASTDDDQMGRIDMTVEISDVKHLQKVIKSLRSVDGVVDVERASR